MTPQYFLGLLTLPKRLGEDKVFSVTMLSASTSKKKKKKKMVLYGGKEIWRIVREVQRFQVMIPDSLRHKAGE